MARAFHGDALGLMEEHARRNMEMFSEAMRMWAPFAGAAPPKSSGDGDKEEPKVAAEKEEIEALRRQLGEMQKTIDTIARRK